METFSALLAICAGNSPVPGDFPAQRPVTRSFDVSLICVWINGWVNNGEAGDLRRHRPHYDVIVMYQENINQGVQLMEIHEYIHQSVFGQAEFAKVPRLRKLMKLLFVFIRTGTSEIM